MQLCDLQVEGPFDFPGLTAAQTLTEFRNHHSVMGNVASGLWRLLLGVLAHFDDIVIHWHNRTEKFTRIYAFSQLRMKRTNGSLRERCP
jgi:hypothetical protein